MFNTSKPCHDCPFLRFGGIRVRPGRVKEVAGLMLSPEGGSFPCHKTRTLTEDGEHIRTGDELHCAGALIFAEKNGNATQIMRIMERLGAYDAKKLMADKYTVAAVFDDIEEMMEAQTA